LTQPLGKDEKKEKASQSIRGRGNEEQNEQAKLDQQAKRALKRKLQRQKKKEKKNNLKQSGKPADEAGMVDNASSTPEKAFDSVENHPAA
jgi:hypothetical protein